MRPRSSPRSGATGSSSRSARETSASRPTCTTPTPTSTPSSPRSGGTSSSLASRVYVTRRVPDRVRRELGAAFELHVHDELDAPRREELLAAVGGAEGLVTVPVDRVDARLLEAAGPGLRIVAQYGAGYDNVDLDVARERAIVVTNTPDVLTRASAELTIALVLALLRRVAEGDRLVRSGA